MVATEVQKAARKVLQENSRLRALLAEKGVIKAEIEAFLSSYDRDISFTAASSTSELAGAVDPQGQARPLANLQHLAKAHTSDATNQSVLAVSPPDTPMDIEFGTARQPDKNGEYGGSPDYAEAFQPGEQSEKDLERRIPSPNILGPVSDCYCPEIESVPGQIQSSETECSVAASILAGFRGHGDVQQARDDLGCTNNAECGISNTVLFNVLDSEHAVDSQLCYQNTKVKL